MGLGLDNPVHLAIVLLVVVLLFGAKRLPELGRSLGGGIRGFKDSITGVDGHPPLAQAEAPGNGSPAGDKRGSLTDER
jgi:sec-independent protein translocase protein TatA